MGSGLFIGLLLGWWCCLLDFVMLVFYRLKGY